MIGDKTALVVDDDIASLKVISKKIALLGYEVKEVDWNGVRNTCGVFHVAVVGDLGGDGVLALNHIGAGRKILYTLDDSDKYESMRAIRDGSVEFHSKDEPIEEILGVER